MPDFVDRNLRGARFQNVDLGHAHFKNVDLSGFRVRGGYLAGGDVSGEIEGLQINGVDVAPLVEAELDRRYPDRHKMRPTDAEGFREAWEVLQQLWRQTVARARTMDPEQLHLQVDGEWSFIETLRHLVFATDAWVVRALLGNPSPWDPLDLPHDEMPAIPGVPRAEQARPSLEQVLAVRADRQAVVTHVLQDLTDADLASMTTPVPETGYPASESFPVIRCLRAVINEEWEHRLFAERDLDVLSLGPPGG